MSRRQLLGGTFAGLVGCSTSDVPIPPPAASQCADPFVGAELLGTIPFLDEDRAPLETPIGEGLGGRLYTDLSKLAPETLITPNETYYVRTRYPDRLDPNAPWKIALGGLVRAPADVSLDRLLPKVARDPFGPFVMECSGNGSFAGFGMLSAARWSGIPIRDVLAFADVLPQATHVLVSGFDDHSSPPGRSTPGASWIFPLEELDRAGAFLATQMNGAPLPKDHGFPIRLIVPNWYGCTCIKWVNEISLVDEGATATEQMKEFASRTHQDGVPTLARDYKPATIDQAAMPVRIDKLRHEGRVVYRVTGVMWGGYRVNGGLTIRFAPDDPFVPVDACPPQTQNQTWTLWTHGWSPKAAGRYLIRLRVADRSIPTKRLDTGFYERVVEIRDV